MSDEHQTPRTDDRGGSAAANEVAISLAAALGGTLLGVTPDRRGRDLASTASS
ncbi:hypothetical protein [Pseudactinotalea terrae]|uniref:hypothetical protein n=1 Tax=Pseudactinotalea terrae TaxID=1743262 RepID=UPI0012E3072F|nr:hypothetical protein [Pseudactinotalea terrae]